MNKILLSLILGVASFSAQATEIRLVVSPQDQSRFDRAAVQLCAEAKVVTAPDFKLSGPYHMQLDDRYSTDLLEVQTYSNAMCKLMTARATKHTLRGVMLGDSTQTVLYETQWGIPREFNRTTTVNGKREQWVYKGGYLYFENGILTAVQN